MLIKEPLLLLFTANVAVLQKIADFAGVMGLVKTDTSFARFLLLPAAVGEEEFAIPRYFFFLLPSTLFLFGPMSIIWKATAKLKQCCMKTLKMYIAKGGIGLQACVQCLWSECRCNMPNSDLGVIFYDPRRAVISKQDVIGDEQISRAANRVFVGHIGFQIFLHAAIQLIDRHCLFRGPCLGLEGRLQVCVL